MADFIHVRTVQEGADQLLTLLRHQASTQNNPGTEHSEVPGEDAPGQADSREQAKGAGSTVDQLSASKKAEQLANANAMAVLEAGDDPTKKADGPPPVKEADSTTKTVAATDSPDLIKQATTLADTFKIVCANIQHNAEIERTWLAKKAEAVAEAQAAVAEAIPVLQETLGLDEEQAAGLAQEIVTENIGPEEVEAMAEQAANLQEIQAATGESPETILQVASELGQAALDNGMSAEDVASQTEGVLRQAATEIALQTLREQHKEALGVLKQAQTDGNVFDVTIARARVNSIMHQACTLLGVAHQAMDDEEDVSAAGESQELEDEPVKPEGEVDTSGGGDPGTSEEDVNAAEDVAQELLAQGVEPETVAAVQQAVTDLIDNGMPVEEVAAVLQEMGDQTGPDLQKVAATEQAKWSRRDFAHMFINEAVHKARTEKGK